MFEQVIPSFSCPVDSCQVPSSRCCCHAFLMYGQAIHFQPPQAPTPSVAPGPHFLSSLTTQCPQYSVGKNNHSCFVFFFSISFLPDAELESLLKKHFVSVSFFKGTVLSGEDCRRVKVSLQTTASLWSELQARSINKWTY